MSLMGTVLMEEMKQLATGKVEAYLEADLALDLNRMKQGKVGETYLWLLRSCGTVMGREDWLQYQNSPDFVEVSYYHPSAILGAYRVTLTAIEEEQVYGTIQPILNYHQYYQEMMVFSGLSQEALIELELENGNRLEVTKSLTPDGFNYDRFIASLKLNPQTVKKVRYLAFY